MLQKPVNNTSLWLHREPSVTFYIVVCHIDNRTRETVELTNPVQFYVVQYTIIFFNLSVWPCLFHLQFFKNGAALVSCCCWFTCLLFLNFSVQLNSRHLISCI